MKTTADKKELEERKESISRDAHKAITNYEDPFLAKTILTISRDDNHYDKPMSEYLEVSQEVINRVIGHLENSGLIEIIKNNKIGTTQNGRYYLQNMLSGEFESIPNWEKLTPDEALTVMKTAEPHVSFKYVKRFDFTKKQIQSLKVKIAEGVKELEERQKEFLYENFGIPKETKTNISFVKHIGLFDEYDDKENVGRDLIFDYKTLEEAFQDKKLSGIYGFHRLDFSSGQVFPPDLIELRKNFFEKELYDIKILYVPVHSSKSLRMPLARQRDYMEIAKKLIEASKKSVPDKREETAAPYYFRYF